MTTSEQLLTRDRSTDMAAVPTPAATVWFIVLVLALSATKLLGPTLDRVGAPPPGWLEPVTDLIGGGLSTVWAVLVVGTVSMGWSAVRRLLRVSVRVGVGGRLYLAALAGPLAITGVAAALAAVATGTLPALAEGTRPAPLEDLALWALLTVVAAPLFVLSENLGWRAWLQRGLQVRHSPVVAGVVVGLVWTVWHLPLFEIDPLFAALPFVPFLLATVARSVLLAGLFNASRSSILPVAVAHFAFNIGTQLALPADAAAAGPLYVAMTVVSAVAAVALARWSRAQSVAISGERAALL